MEISLLHVFALNICQSNQKCQEFIKAIRILFEESLNVSPKLQSGGLMEKPASHLLQPHHEHIFLSVMAFGANKAKVFHT